MEKQKNTRAEQSRSIPELRFSGFDGEYNKKPLGKIAQINASTNSLPESFTYIDLESVVKGQLVKKSVIKKSEAPSRAQRFLEPNDILFQMVRPYQQNNLYFDLTGDYVASTGYAQIKTKEDSRFLYQYLHTRKFVNEVIDKCTGTSYPAINSKDLARIYVCFPTLPEQQKIASFFTAIDQKISHLKQKHELLEQYKKGVMQKIFSQQIRFRDDDGSEFPKWEKKRLGEVYSFRSTNSFSRENLNYIGGEIKNIHYGDIHTRFRTLFDISKEDVPFLNKNIINQGFRDYSFCRQGDLVFADASEDLTDVGKCIEIVNVGNDLVVAGLHTILSRPDLHTMGIGFGGYLMQSINVRKQIMREAQGSKVSSISPTRLSNVKLSIPSLPEQTKIAYFLSAIDDKIQHTQKQIDQTEQWKKGLMQRMFV